MQTRFPDLKAEAARAKEAMAYEGGIPDSEVRSQYVEARDYLDLCTERLQETVHELEVRLGPALRQEKADGGTAAAAEMKFHGSSDVVRHLNTAAELINTITYRVGRIRDDIEL